MCARIFVAQGHSEIARTEIQKYLSSGATDNRSVAEQWLEAIEEPYPGAEIVR
jgi:hypothetical protein